mmetsp:Transcript_35242/g.55053  ORF Transcript_35242/g.55053 Transcript_35242/m.55053 type:complete len:135 (-) Transcript_35242:195-599(-)
MSKLHVARGKPRWKLVGSSLGGYLAARWAELNPDAVESMVLLCPAYDFPKILAKHIGKENFKKWQLQGSFQFPDCTGEPIPVHWGLMEDSQTHCLRPSIQVRTLVIHGSDDEVVSLSSSQQIVKDNPHVRLTSG